MKKKILALAIGGILSAGAQAASIDDILITEYVEPDGGNVKAVEISNLGTGSFTFPADIYMSKQSNGSDTNWSLILKTVTVGGVEVKQSALNGMELAEGQTIVFLNEHADTVALKATLEGAGVAVIASSNINQNGDDPIALLEVTDTSSMNEWGSIDATPTPSPIKILDIVGLPGQGKSADLGIADVTLRRQIAIKAKNATYTAAEWISQVNPNLAVITDGLGKIPANDPAAPVVGPVVDTCSPETQTTVAEVQGNTWSSPLVRTEDKVYVSDAEYYVTGVVSAVTEGVKTGFYLYASDGDATTSDGLFVKTKKATSDMVGKTVCVQSKVYEDYGMTQLQSDTWTETAAAVQIVSAEEVKIIDEDADSFKATLERHEGMLVKFPKDMDTREVGSLDANGVAIDTAGEQNMHVTRNFSFDYDYFRNNVVLSYKRPNMQPNQANVPGSAAANAQAAQNADYTLVLESNTSDDDTKPDELAYYPALRADPAKNYIRIDDSVSGLEGVIVYRTGVDRNGVVLPAGFTVIASNNNPDLDFDHNTDRKDAYKLGKKLEGIGKVASGDIEIKIATQNVLNYFNSPFGGATNNHGDNRGATSYSEYEKQKAKIVSAIRGLDSDIVGLMEIENNGFGEGSAIAELVAEVNLAYDEPKLSKEKDDNSTSNIYAFVGFDSNGDVVIDGEDSIGGDAITSGMLYRPAKVSLDAVKIIPMPSQHDDAVVNDNGVVIKNYTNSVLESGDNYMRDSLAVTFIINQTGKKLTVAVNHLKSKGSTCTEDWDGVEFGTIEKLQFNEDKALLAKYGSNDDQQGNCENFRVAAAVQLGEELEKISGDKIVMGDMNSYAKEDPMLVLTENPTGQVLKAARKTYIGRVPQVLPSNLVVEKTYGYLNAVSKYDPDGWSYSFGEVIGSLDHLLITPTLEDRLVAATDWHINAAESTLFDYNEDKKGEIVGAGWWDVNPDPVSLAAYYVDDFYRSSDHDSAIMVLGYTPGETDSGQPVQLVINGGWIDVPYTIPADAGALTGDVAEITLSNLDGDVYVDMSKVSTPQIALEKDGAQVLGFELIGAKASMYNATMTLKRDGKIVPDSTVSMKVKVTKADSLEPKTVVPEYDGTGSGGGSFGIFSIMSLLGFGFLRRRKA